MLKKGHASSLPLAFDLISNLPDSGEQQLDIMCHFCCQYYELQHFLM
jgi:hypothetical protein